MARRDSVGAVMLSLDRLEQLLPHNVYVDLYRSPESAPDLRGT